MLTQPDMRKEIPYKCCADDASRKWSQENGGKVPRPPKFIIAVGKNAWGDSPVMAVNSELIVDEFINPNDTPAGMSKDQLFDSIAEEGEGSG